LHGGEKLKVIIVVMDIGQIKGFTIVYAVKIVGTNRMTVQAFPWFGRREEAKREVTCHRLPFVVGGRNDHSPKRES
jgi:hypothetical protein